MTALLLALATAHADPAAGDCASLTGDEKTRCQDQKTLNGDLYYLASLGDCGLLAGDPRDWCAAQTKDMTARITLLRKELADLAARAPKLAEPVPVRPEPVPPEAENWEE